MSKNKKIALIFGGFVTAIAAAFYPIFFYPLTHKDEYRHVQKMNRTGINQADIQPLRHPAVVYNGLARGLATNKRLLEERWCEGMVRSIRAYRQVTTGDGLILSKDAAEDVEERAPMNE